MNIKTIKKIYWKYAKKHWKWFLDYCYPNVHNPRKFFRALWWRYLPGSGRFPPFIIIDPIVNCNLQCPLCSIPPRELPRYGSTMDLTLFSEILDAVKNTTNTLIFCHAGEPMLNPSLFDMVTLTNRAGLFSEFGTNGTRLHADSIEKIFASGLDRIQISFDGFSKETYEQYRVGADFDKVLNGITLLAREKRKRRSRKPIIDIYYLVHAYNSHEIEEAGRYFTALGIGFVPKGINLNLHRRTDGKSCAELRHWIETETKYSIYRRDANGEPVFKNPLKKVCDTCLKPVITSEGEILLCCHDIFNSVKLGNIRDVDFKQYWLSPEYRKVRNAAANRMLPVCKVCGK